MRESYTPWRSDAVPRASFDVETVLDDGDGLKVTLSFDDGVERGTVLFRFDGVLAYRALDEGMRNKQWEEHQFSDRCPLYVVEHSRFMRECDELSSGVLTALQPAHYFVCTQNLCVDVLNKHEPRMSIQKEA